eukprot:4585844-Lingulodinium_polyedra.AAC.1
MGSRWMRTPDVRQGPGIPWSPGDAHAGRRHGTARWSALAAWSSWCRALCSAVWLGGGCPASAWDAR